MSIDDQLQKALELQQEGYLQSALTCCRKLLKKNPDDFRIHFFLGMLSQQAGELEEAIRCFEKTVDLAPGLASAHYNLGILHYQSADYERAALAYHQAAEANPEDGDIRFNFGLTLKKLGLLDEAREQYEKALAINPGDTDARYNLGTLMRIMHRDEEAMDCLRKVVAIDPTYISAHNNLGYILHKNGRKEEALVSYRRVLELDPAHESALHMVAALEGETTKAPPLGYVRELFDHFADFFDEALLEKLYYTTPEQLRALLKKHFNGRITFRRGLDMGCGTGLSGLAFTGLVEELTCLDLSPQMLAKAKEKEIYTRLVEDDIISYLDREDKRFDFFLASDVFVYLGDLRPVFERIKGSAEDEACFLFSTEQSEEDFVLQPSGRYAHSEAYIRRLADRFGFTVEMCQTASLRKENDNWVQGHLFLLKA